MIPRISRGSIYHSPFTLSRGMLSQASLDAPGAVRIETRCELWFTLPVSFCIT